jgi:diguanylate cyclase (GGDEF)-like protein/PAS domain S-box-containing protein
MSEGPLPTPLGRSCDALLDLSRDAIVVVDSNTMIVQANAAACTMFGLKPEELVGSDIHRFRAPAAPSLASLLDTDAGAPARVVETVLRRATGSVFPCEASVRAVEFERGPAYVAVLRDITERRRAATDLAFKSLLLDTTTDSVLVHTLDGDLRYANRAAYESRGYTGDEFMALPPFGWVAPPYRMNAARHRDEMSDRGELRLESVNLRKDGTTMPVEVIARIVEIGGESCAVAVVRDMTERREAEAKIRFMAYHDNLTGLPNRKLFHDRLVEALGDCRHSGLLLTLLFVDLDDFKPINDTYGHAVGDKLLAAVADRLSDCVRDGDTVARYGGDEFVVLLRDVRAEHDAEVIAEKLLGCLREPFSVEGLELSISASVGGTTSHTGCEDMDTLLRAADSAMYRAKDLGTPSLIFHAADLINAADPT